MFETFPPLASSLTGDRSDYVVQSDTVTVFKEVTEEQAGLAVWRRKLSPEVIAAADLMRTASIDEVYRVSAVDIENNRFRPGNIPDVLSEDVSYLAYTLCQLISADVVNVRLETVADDSCRLFHVDNVMFRLVTTYVGAGTQWVPADCEKIARSEQNAYAGEIKQLASGDVALFRGKKSEGHRVLHRSPQLPTGEKRLVCVIDAVI